MQQRVQWPGDKRILSYTPSSPTERTTVCMFDFIYPYELSFNFAIKLIGKHVSRQKSNRNPLSFRACNRLYDIISMFITAMDLMTVTYDHTFQIKPHIP